MNSNPSDGSMPVRTQSFPAWPFFGQDEIESVREILASGKVNYWTGEQGKHFEQEFACYTGVEHAICVMNGTVALEATLMALGVGPGDEVIVPPRTFIASASCIIARGAKPVFADIDPVSQNITAATIAKALSPRTRAIIVVHLAGWPCDMDPILKLARNKGLWVIEDCAQAMGAQYKGKSVGSLGDVAAFSFCQDKIITTGGEGGMVITRSPEIWSKVWSYRDHGKSYAAVNQQDADNKGFKWLHESFGTNLRMTEMQAAIGRIQLRKLPEWVALRKRNADILTQCCLKIPALRVTQPQPEITHAYYKYYVFIKPELLAIGWDRDRIIEAINAEGIPCYSGSCSEIYLEKAFMDSPWKRTGRLPVAQELGDTSLMFLIHPNLRTGDMHDMARGIEKVMAKALIGE